MQKVKRTLYRLGGGAVVAASGAQVALAQQQPDIRNPVGNNADLGTVLARVIDALLLFAGAVAVLFLIIGGFRYVISAGNPDQVDAAKKTILYAILGLIVIFIAFVLVRLIQNYLGVNFGEVQ